MKNKFRGIVRVSHITADQIDALRKLGYLIAIPRGNK